MRWNYLFSEHEELIDKIIKFFTSKATDPPLFHDIVEKCQNNPLEINNLRHNPILKLGSLTTKDFYFYEETFIKQNRCPVIVIDAILNRLCESGILFTQSILQSSNDLVYTPNEPYARFLYSRGLIKNIIFGFNYIAGNYQDSVFKIIVKTESGNDSIGTGFLINLQIESRIHSVIITNEHVAKYRTGLQVLRKDDQNESWRDIVISDDTDLAAIILDSQIPFPPFHISTDTEILDDIIIIGYPPVPTARDAYQLVHKGEINAHITDYWNKDYVLFSAKNLPGNSGGPIINNMGMIVGIATQQLISQDQNGFQLPYFAAVPSTKILNFIDQQVKSKL